MTYLTEAHDRLVAAIINNKPSEISLFPAPADFEARRDHLKELAFAVDSYVFAVMNDAEGSAPNKITPSDFISPLQTALHDNDAYALLDDAAERLTAEARERAA